VALLSFWSWALGPHPTLKRAGWIILQLAVLILLGYYVHPVIPVLYVLFRLVGWLMFKGMFFEEDCVKVLLFHEDKPRTIDFCHVGKDTWEEMPIVGGELPMKDSAGRVVYVIEKIDEDGIAYMSWIHEASLTEFLRTRSGFDVLAEVAQESAYAFMEIQDIPEILGIQVSKEILDVVEEDRAKEVYTLNPMSDEWKKRLEKLKLAKSPIARALDKVQRKAAKTAVEEAAEERTEAEDLNDQTPE